MRRRTFTRRLLDLTAIVLVPGAAILLLATTLTEQLSWTDSHKAIGVMSKNEIERASEGGQFCTISYAFTDGSGQQVRGHDRIADRFCPTYPAGKAIVIEYVRGDPSRSRIVGDVYPRVHGTISALFTLAILFVGLGPLRWYGSGRES